jgi:Gluconate 2-dehydrogenase subunit 3
MQRRDFVKGMVAIPAAVNTALAQQAPPQPIAPPPATPTSPSPVARAVSRSAAGGRGSRDFKAPPVTAVVPDAIGTQELKFFTAPQFAALRRLSDLLMPPFDGHPGALQVEAPEFMDFLVGASPSERQQLYRTGLDHLNLQARMKFGKAFAELDAKQADEIVRPALLPWMTDNPPLETFPRFIAIAHKDIRTATMNSEAWSIAAASSGERAPGVGLYWRPIDPDLKY